jgi:hypothetical protein
MIFVLGAYRQLIPMTDLAELAEDSIPVLAAVLAVQVVFARLIRQPYKPGIATSLSVVFFCFFGDLKMRCQSWFYGTKWGIFGSASSLLPIAGIIYLVLLWRLWRTRRNLFTLHRYLNVIGSVMVLAALPGVLSAPSRMKPPVNHACATPLHTGSHPPDIYYILTDSYTSPESLRSYWGYDDSPLVSFLTGAGFRVVGNAHGNATFTPTCLATSLNMDYPPPLTNNASMAAQVAYHNEIIEEAEAPARLKASGYEITSLSIFAAARQPRFYYYPQISRPTLGTVMWNDTALGNLDAYRLRAKTGEANLKILSMLPEIAANRDGRPKFVYAHLLMPHSPYLFDKDGHHIRRGMGRPDDHPDLYLGQLIYENQLLTNAIAGILRNSATPPVIVLQGDHGYRYLPGAHQGAEATTILNALYLPGAADDWVYPGITPVNTFRVLFNHYFGEHYARLPDCLPPTLSQFVSRTDEEK